MRQQWQVGTSCTISVTVPSGAEPVVESFVQLVTCAFIKCTMPLTPRKVDRILSHRGAVRLPSVQRT